MTEFCAPDYQFYNGVFLGRRINEGDFPELAQRAAEFMRGSVGEIIDRVPEKDRDALRRAACAVAEVLQEERRAAQRIFAEKPVSEETVGNYSVRYDSSYFSSAEIQFLKDRKLEALRVYLSGVPALAGLFHARSFSCSRRI